MSTQKITALGMTFDATKVAPQQPMEAVPAGWYSVVITDAELKLTEGGIGRRLAIEWTITEGQFKGRKIFDGFNILHSNEQTQSIAAAQLSAVCHAIQVFQVADASQLLNKPHQIKVNIEPERWVDADNQTVEPNTPNAKKYEAKNTFKGAKAGSAPVATGAPAGAPAPAWAATGAAVPGSTTPPWGGAAPAASAPAPAPAAPAPAAAAPASAPAKPAGKPGRKPAAKPAAAAPAKPERKFYIGLDGDAYAEAWPESKVVDALSKGMPADTPIVLEGEQEYKTPAQYAVGAAPAPAPVAAPAAPVAAPAPAPAAPVAAAPAGGLPPWAK